ncbi:MAG: hypothetical protein IT577_23375 [Verrucomicrobiae bacterium]|nr:hypothetical protein [Verrucomicrobiae bacterium]
MGTNTHVFPLASAGASPFRFLLRVLRGSPAPHLLTALLLTLAQGQAAEPNPSPPRPAPTPQALAAAYEHAGRKAEAAAIYEQLAATNAVARKVLAPRLVQIYAETGRTNAALKWAREVMRDNPDPQAYLAGVYSRMGQPKQAQQILEREIAANTNATRAVTLRWQLADVHEKAGDKAQARKVMREGATAAKGTPMEAAAQRRLKSIPAGAP